MENMIPISDVIKI